MEEPKPDHIRRVPAATWERLKHQARDHLAADGLVTSLNGEATSSSDDTDTAESTPA